MDDNLYQKPFALWIDLEGFQDQFFKGAEITLSSENCKMIKIEVETEILFKGQKLLCNDIDQKLRNYNFIPIFRDFEYQYQFNVLYLKSDLTDLASKDIQHYFKKCTSKNLNIFSLIKILSNKDNLITEIKFFLLNLLGKNYTNKLRKLRRSILSKN